MMSLQISNFGDGLVQLLADSSSKMQSQAPKASSHDFYKSRDAKKFTRKQSRSNIDEDGAVALKPPRRASQKFISKVASQIQLEVHNAEQLRSHGHRKSAYVPSEVVLLPNGRTVEISEDRREMAWVNFVARFPKASLALFTFIPIVLGIIVAVTAGSKIQLDLGYDGKGKGPS